MTDLAKLVVRLEAETARYQKELDSARRKLRTFDRDSRESVNRIGKAAAVAVAGLGLFATRSLAAQDRAGKLAQQLSVTTDALSGLRFAAEQTGAGASALDKGLEVMSKRLGEVAIKGSGAAAPAIERLGLSIDDLMRMDPAQQFETIADAVAELSTQSERNAVTANIFSRANQSLVNTLALGRDGLREMREEAGSLGAVITDDMAANAALATDAINRMQKASQGFANVAASSMAPVITAIAEGLADDLSSNLKDSRGDVVDWGDTFGDVVSVVGDIFRTGLFTIKTEAAILGRTLGAMGAQAVSLAKFDFAAVGAIQRELIADTAALRKGYETFDTRKFRGELAKVRDEIGKTTEETRGNRLNIPLIEPTFELPATLLPAANDSGLSPAEERALAGVDAYNRALEEGRRVYEATRTDAELLADEQARLNQLLTVGAINQDTYNRALDDAQERFQSTQNEAEQWSATMDEIAASAASNIQSAFADFLFDPFSDGLDGMVENFARTVQRMLAEAAAAAVINKLFGSANSEGGGLEGAIGGFLSQAFGGARASGGPVSSGKAYLVGENGPELMVPGTAGHIVSNEVLNQQAVNQTIVVHAPTGAVSRATELQIQSAAGRGVAGAMRRNG